ncbi:hypothetical protein Aduo_006769 [Ancylostoma duodenale]
MRLAGTILIIAQTILAQESNSTKTSGESTAVCVDQGVFCRFVKNFCHSPALSNKAISHNDYLFHLRESEDFLIPCTPAEG